MIERLLSEVLTKRFEEDDLQDCFLVDIHIGSNDRVEVFIDSDSNLTLERCRIVSRYLEKQIEEQGWLGEKYTLEVSSPGLDRPLKLKRQYIKNIGRDISISTTTGSTYKGQLASVSEDSIVVMINDSEKLEVEFGQIKKAKIIASFK